MRERFEPGPSLVGREDGRAKDGLSKGCQVGCRREHATVTAGGGQRLCRTRIGSRKSNTYGLAPAKVRSHHEVVSLPGMTALLLFFGASKDVRSSPSGSSSDEWRDCSNVLFVMASRAYPKIWNAKLE